MKICITSQGETIDALIDPRFGRCQYFIIVNSENMEFKAFKNEQAEQRGGVGISSAQFIIDEGVDILITGSIGPNASQALANSKCRIITGISGTVREAVEKVKRGEI